jgi:hypothetical protein
MSRLAPGLFTIAHSRGTVPTVSGSGRPGAGSARPFFITEHSMKSPRPALAAILALTLGFGVTCHATAAAVEAQQIQAPMAGAMTQWPDSIDLTDKDIKALINVTSKLRELGVKIQPQPDGTITFGDSVAMQNEAMNAMNAVGMTPQGMQQIAFNVGMAMAALDTDMDEIRRNMQQFEQMKQQVPPEQWAAFEANIGQAYKLMERIESQPAGNVTLVQRYQDELREAMDIR